MAQPIRETEHDFIIDEINLLINLEYDAIRTYETAIHRLHGRSCRLRLESFKQDHIRHSQGLAAIVSQYGGKPTGQSELRAVLNQGKVVVGNIVGDQGVLKAMNANERTTNELYERALDRLGNKPDIAQLLRENLRDEKKHRDWIEQALKAM